MNYDVNKRDAPRTAGDASTMHREACNLELYTHFIEILYRGHPSSRQ